jgi:putative transposase
MATFRRSIVPGATYFFTVNTDRRQRVLTQTTFYSAIKETVRSVLSERPFVIEAFVLLPDHLHCIWTLPPDDADYATRWSMIKRGVRHVDYIHWNPVKHGYVREVRDWPYSSFHRFVARGYYPIDWAGGSSAFTEMEAGEFEDS